MTISGSSFSPQNLLKDVYGCKWNIAEGFVFGALAYKVSALFIQVLQKPPTTHMYVANVLFLGSLTGALIAQLDPHELKKEFTYKKISNKTLPFLCVLVSGLWMAIICEGEPHIPAVKIVFAPITCLIGFFAFSVLHNRELL